MTAINDTDKSSKIYTLIKMILIKVEWCIYLYFKNKLSFWKLIQIGCLYLFPLTPKLHHRIHLYSHALTDQPLWYSERHVSSRNFTKMRIGELQTFIVAKVGLFFTDKSDPFLNWKVMFCLKIWDWHIWRKNNLG